MIIKNSIESLSGYNYVLNTKTYDFVIRHNGEKIYQTVLYGLRVYDCEEGLSRDMDFINRSNPSYFRQITKQVMEDYRRKVNGN